MICDLRFQAKINNPKSKIKKRFNPSPIRFTLAPLARKSISLFVFIIFLQITLPISSLRGRTPPFSPFALIPAYAGISKLDSATRELGSSSSDSLSADATAEERLSPSHTGSGRVRIKDIARISYVHNIQLHGYGLVVGLNGTGDSAATTFTIQSVINMMQRFGIDVPKGRLGLRNVAAVMVTAELPFFAKAGSRIDALVSSIGDAKSIAGGTLLATHLCPLDGLYGHGASRPYVLAQGPVSVGGFSISTGDGAAGAGSQSLSARVKNHPTVGRVPNGGVIIYNPPRAADPNSSQRGRTTPFSPFALIPAYAGISKLDSATRDGGTSLPDTSGDDTLAIVLNEPDFTTATRIVSAINSAETMHAAGQAHPISYTGTQQRAPMAIRDPIARAVDAGMVEVTVPSPDKEDLVAFISRLENVTAVPDSQALVVIDERTGTIVVGKDVRISPVAVSHSNLNIQIKTEEEASQPPPMSTGETVIISRSDLAVQEERQAMRVIRGGATIDEVVRALNLIGVMPRDMIVILQAMKRAGALHAELVIM